MDSKLIWTTSAFKDLQNIIQFITEDSHYYAMNFYEDVMSKAQTVTVFPHRCRIVPELSDPNMREILYIDTD